MERTVVLKSKLRPVLTNMKRNESAEQVAMVLEIQTTQDDFTIYKLLEIPDDLSRLILISILTKPCAND